MTIVAYKNGVIAADSLVMNRGCKMGHVVKLAKNAAGDICGASGDTSWCAAFLTWFCDGDDTSPMPTISYADADATDSAIIIRVGQPDIVHYVLSSPKYFPHTVTIAGPQGIAIGSGKAEAMGAMYAGGDAIKACEAAIVLDDGCGGPINWLRLGVH